MFSDEFNEDLNVNKKEALLTKQIYNLVKFLRYESGDNMDCANKVSNIFKAFQICFGKGKFNVGRQEDSHEFLIYLLDSLHIALSCEIEYNISGTIMNDRDRIMKESFEQWVDFIKKGYSVISKHFFGQFYKNIYSQDGDKLLSTTYQSFNHLTIPINDGCKTVYDCLDAFFEDEMLEDDNQYFHEEGDEHIDAYIGQKIIRTPDVLVIVLKRFINGLRKINSLVEFPINDLDMSKYVYGYDAGNTIYDLVCVGNHTGGMGGGHYFAYTRKSDGWYICDDTRVQKMDESRIVSPVNYYLIYKKKQFRQQ
jgi:ubiquitin C-terminal hydrolase